MNKSKTMNLRALSMAMWSIGSKTGVNVVLH